MAGVDTTIGQRELRNDSGAIMRRVQQGERFVVTRNGIPVADLLPHDPSGGRGVARFVSIADIAQDLTALPSWGVPEFRRDAAELDEHLDDRDVDRWVRRR